MGEASRGLMGALEGREEFLSMEAAKALERIGDPRFTSAAGFSNFRPILPRAGQQVPKCVPQEKAG